MATTAAAASGFSPKHVVGWRSSGGIVDGRNENAEYGRCVPRRSECGAVGRSSNTFVTFTQRPRWSTYSHRHRAYSDGTYGRNSGSDHSSAGSGSRPAPSMSLAESSPDRSLAMPTGLRRRSTTRSRVWSA